MSGHSWVPARRMSARSLDLHSLQSCIAYLSPDNPDPLALLSGIEPKPFSRILAADPFSTQ